MSSVFVYLLVKIYIHYSHRNDWYNVETVSVHKTFQSAFEYIDDNSVKLMVKKCDDFGLLGINLDDIGYGWVLTDELNDVKYLIAEKTVI